MTQASGRQHLLIDADDTLWENNIYFEDAFDEFVDFLGHSSMSAAEIRVVLDEIEIANIKIHGYGAANFARGLAQCYERLAEREIRRDDLATVMSFAERILDCPMQLIEGVAQTLEYLATRHELTLFTKGHPEEQKLKIDRSGVGSFFAHAEIVKEKTADAYRALVDAPRLATLVVRVVDGVGAAQAATALSASLAARMWAARSCGLFPPTQRSSVPHADAT